MYLVVCVVLSVLFLQKHLELFLSVQGSTELLTHTVKPLWWYLHTHTQAHTHRHTHTYTHTHTHT